MRLIHKIPFSAQEVESFRQLIFNNLTHGLKYVLESMEDMELEVQPEHVDYVELIESATDLRDGEVFPSSFHEPLRALWNDKGVQQAWDRGNEAALPEKCAVLLLPYPSDITTADQPVVFLCRLGSSFPTRLRTHRARHRALSCTDNRHHRNCLPAARPRDVDG